MLLKYKEDKRNFGCRNIQVRNKSKIYKKIPREGVPLLWANKSKGRYCLKYAILLRIKEIS